MGRTESLQLPLLASLTLGLAPFYPQPHILEKIRWMTIGKPLAIIDWLDVLMHGAPWVWLAYTVVVMLRHRK